MEKRRKGETLRKVSHICLLLLALLQITTPSSAQSNAITTSSSSAPNPAALGYSTRPADVKVAVGEPAVFYCGVPKASPTLTFTYYGSHGNYSLNCPHGHVEDIPQALSGSCDMKKEESLAVWTLKGTSFSNNGTRVVCQLSNNAEAPAAVLHVYDNGTNHATLIGCVIGGFFGTLLVAGLAFTLLRRSETFQKCYRGKETEDDISTMVAKN